MILPPPTVSVLCVLHTYTLTHSFFTCKVSKRACKACTSDVQSMCARPRVCVCGWVCACVRDHVCVCLVQMRIALTFFPSDETNTHFSLSLSLIQEYHFHHSNKVLYFLGTFTISVLPLCGAFLFVSSFSSSLPFALVPLWSIFPFLSFTAFTLSLSLYF